MRETAPPVDYHAFHRGLRFAVCLSGIFWAVVAGAVFL